MTHIKTVSDRSSGAIKIHLELIQIIVHGTGKVMATVREIWFDPRSEMDLEGKTEIKPLKL